MLLQCPILSAMENSLNALIPASGTERRWTELANYRAQRKQLGRTSRIKAIFKITNVTGESKCLFMRWLTRHLTLMLRALLARVSCLFNIIARETNIENIKNV